MKFRRLTGSGFAALLSASLAASLAACGGGGSGTPLSAAPEAPPATETPAPQAPAPTPPGAAAPTDPGQGTVSPADPDGGGARTPFGETLRTRMLTALSGSAGLFCEAADGSTNSQRLTLDSQGLQFGDTLRPLSTLVSFAVGSFRYAPGNYQPPASGGNSLVFEAAFTTAAGIEVHEVTFDPTGNLVELRIGSAASLAEAPLAEGAWVGVAYPPAQSCVPVGVQAWNTNPVLKGNADVAYAQLASRQTDYAARTLACHSLSGYAPEEWSSQVRQQGGIITTSPRASRPGDDGYSFADTEYLSHYTRVYSDDRVGHYVIHPGTAQWAGYGLILGADEEIVGFKSFQRVRSVPSNQLCTLP